MTIPATIVLHDISPADFMTLPRRGYEFNKGDRRFRDLDTAVDHANDEAIRTGVRQIVRPTYETPEFVGKLWLVQAVGS